MKERLLDSPFTTSLIQDQGYTIEPIKRGLSEIMPIFKIKSMFPSVFIAGGYARYCLSTRAKPFEASDLDLFVLDKTEMQELVEFFPKFTPFTDTVVTRGGATHSFYHPLRRSEYIGLHNENREFYGCANIRIQVNLSKFGTLKEVLDNFDMTVAQFALLDEEHGICHRRAIDDDVTGVLNFIREDDDPYLRMKRIIKYLKKGYNLPLSEVEKLFTRYQSLSRQEKIENYIAALDSNEWYPHVMVPQVEEHAQRARAIPVRRNFNTPF